MFVCYLLCTGAGAYAGCVYCTTKGEYCKELSKMVYLKHRCFLPCEDDLLKSDSGFPNKKAEIALVTPVMKSTRYIEEANARYESTSTAAERTKIAQETGCKGTYSLSRLPNHNRILSTPPEPMHLFKNIAEHLVSLLAGRRDSAKVRNAEKRQNRFRATWIGNNHKGPLPPAPFVFSKDEAHLANQRCISIRVPSWIDWKQKQLFAKTVYLKSAEWRHVLASGILKFCVRGCLGKKQRTTLYELCNVIADLCAMSIDPDEMHNLEYRTSRALSLLERDYPVTLHVIVYHLLHHLPMFVQLYGPIHSFWMYPLERFNSWLSQRVLSKRYPESTVLETYRLFEVTSFFQLSKQLPIGATGEIELEHEGQIAADESANTIPLKGEHFNMLNRYYQKEVQVYGALIERYEMEKRTLGCDEFHPLHKWSPSSGPTLTSVEQTLLLGPSDQILKCSTLIVSHRSGRKIKYSSEESDKSTAGFSSSYVCTKIRDSETVLFGRIQFLFKHSFNDNISNLACVHWFNGYSVDRESGLLCVNINSLSPQNPITVLNKLSPPLIHAVDENNVNKIWILNYHVSLLY